MCQFVTRMSFEIVLSLVHFAIVHVWWLTYRSIYYVQKMQNFTILVQGYELVATRKQFSLAGWSSLL